MRSHPVVGLLFLLAAATFFVLGAFSSGAPAPLENLPIPPAILVPFLFWQTAVWCTMFGIFFLRARRRDADAGTGILAARRARRRAA